MNRKNGVRKPLRARPQKKMGMEMIHFRVVACLAALPFCLLAGVMIISCAAERKAIDAGMLIEKYEFIKDGKVTKQEIISRLGDADNTYEDGRIMTYWWRENSMVYNLVLVFGKEDVLERHSIIRVR